MNIKSTSGIGFRPDIEGLRAVAILLVIGFHSNVPGFAGGFIGVDVFFVVSGYLITTLLLEEASKTGKIDFRRFYARRARRLLPAVALVGAFSLLVGRLIYSPIEQEQFAKSGLAMALYVSNVWFARTSTDYLASSADDDPFLHTWSLGVEEQFYLVWPLLVALAIRLVTGAKPSQLYKGFIGIACISFALCVWLTTASPEWAFFGPTARAWQFAVGAAGAVVTRHRTEVRFGGALGLAGLLVIAGSAALMDRQTHFPGTAALFPVLGTFAVLISGSQAAPVGAVALLRATPLQRIGRLSYSWYLWHWPILIFTSSLVGDLHTWQRLACCGVALGLAAVTYSLVELPVRQSRWLNARPGYSLALAACLTIASGLASGLWFQTARHNSLSGAQREFASAHRARPRVYDVGCHAPFALTRHPECSFGDPHGSRTVVLFGDSHAAQWFPAVERISVERRWRLISLTKSACPVANISINHRRLRRRYYECESWREEMVRRIGALRPDLVILASRSSEYVSHLESPQSSEWSEGLRLTLAAVTLTAHKTVLLRDTPNPGFSIPICLSRVAWAPWRKNKSCSFKRVDAVYPALSRLEERVSAAFPSVTWLDLTNHFCGPLMCDPFVSGEIAYKDGSHVSARLSARLYTVLLDALEGHAELPASSTGDRRTTASQSSASNCTKVRANSSETHGHVIGATTADGGPNVHSAENPLVVVRNDASCQP